MTSGQRLASSDAIRPRQVPVPLRLALALAVLALPLAGGIWAVGSFAAEKERERADSRLTASLRAVVAASSREANQLTRRARELAFEEPVRRAFLRSDRAALARLTARKENTTFAVGSQAVPRPDDPALVRAARVDADGERLGSVAVFAPLDDELVRRLRRNAGLPDDVRLAFADARGRVIAPRGLRGDVGPAAAGAFDASLGGSRYRAVSAPLGDDGPRLMALVPGASIASAERRARAAVLVAGLVTLLSVIVIAYLLAPGIARARLGKQQREQAARVLERVGDGICAVDGEGVIRLWNPAAAAITGLAATAVRDRPARTAVPGWGKIEELVPVSDSPAGGRAAVTLPLDLDGRELWLSVSAVRSNDGTVYAFRDLTEERRFEAMRSDLVATVSHELRTPLASIQGAAFTLRRRDPELDPETRDHLLAIVAEQSKRLARLADEILLTSQLGVGRAEVHEHVLDPEAIARDVVEAARLEASPELAIVLHVAGEVPGVVGDRDRLRQVLANLVDNAIKYSPEGGTVQIRVGRTGDDVRFSVRDEGIGIPAREHDRIFEKFYRLDPQLSRGVGGGGLGLYICRELVHYMGGRIWVESEAGRGSTFFVELPVDAAAPASAA